MLGLRAFWFSGVKGSLHCFWVLIRQRVGVGLRNGWITECAQPHCGTGAQLLEMGPEMPTSIQSCRQPRQNLCFPAVSLSNVPGWVGPSVPEI